MALREIFVWPDPILKSKAKPVGEVDASIRKLCDDMAETMYDAHGVGLAAPQIGALQRVIAIDVDQRDTAGDDEVSEAEVQQPKKRKGAPRTVERTNRVMTTGSGTEGDEAGDSSVGAADGVAKVATPRGRGVASTPPLFPTCRLAATRNGVGT